MTEFHASPQWQQRRQEISARLASESLDDFLQWSVIQAVMFVADAPYIYETELPYLQSRPDWPRWKSAITEDEYGSPPTINIEGVITSGNLIHQAYHLARWEEATGQTIIKLKRILEFGGGYGAMCKVARRAGFKGRYIIADFPELQALQKAYLQALNIPVTFQGEFTTTPDLFIACWSLSEVNGSDVALEILTKAKAGGALLAYHPRWDNSNVGDVIEHYFSLHSCPYLTSSIDHLLPNKYLFGPIR